MDLEEKNMLIEKQYVGKNEITNGEISYYMIKKDTVYGAELTETSQNKITSVSEYFSEDSHETLVFVNKLYEHCVTLVTLTDIIDDYISAKN